VTVNIVLAVFSGIAIAVVLFVVSMSRSVVRRSYRCGATRSRRSRTADDLALLAQRGEAILVMELQGALFFGTGEKLVQEIDNALMQKTAFVILNLRRVNEIDSTGARALLEINAMLQARQKMLFLKTAPRRRFALMTMGFGVVAGAAGFPALDDEVARAAELPAIGNTGVTDHRGLVVQ
jgi:sulfate permease, SulP family